MTTTTLSAPLRSTNLSRIVSAPVALAAMILVSVVAQTIAAFPRATVTYLPDEYLYAQLARSLGQGNGSTVLGQSVSLPAMLEPLLTAGFWQLSDAETSLHLTQAFHSLLMALAAIPVYLIARQLRLTTGAALTCALISLIFPGVLYVSYVTADSLGYLLALVAIHAAVRACVRPTFATQSWFLTAAVLATFARLQYASLIPAFFIAALAVERFRPVRTVRRFAVVSVAIGMGVGAVVVLGGSVLGRYGAVTAFGVSESMLHWTFRTSALLIAVTGAAIAPGAFAWLFTRIVRPSSDTARTAFAALTIVMLGTLVVAAAAVSAGTHSDRFLERYLLVAFPLVAIAFFCWIDDKRPGRAIAIVCACAVVIAAAREPVSGDLLGQGTADSPSLHALSRLGGMIGLAEASLVAALVVSVCALLALLAAFSRRIHVAALVVPTVLVLGVVMAGAHVADVRASERAYSNAFVGDATWIEDAHPGPTTLVQTPDSNPYIAMVTSVWNPSLVRAEPFGRVGVAPLDGLGKQAITAGKDGVLREHDGRPVKGSVLFATGGSQPLFSAGAKVVRARYYSLVIPTDETVRLRAFAAGVRATGTVGAKGFITAYPTATGACTRASLRLTLPIGLSPTVVEFRDASGHVTTRKIVAGKHTTVSVVSSPSSARTLKFRATKVGDLLHGGSAITMADGMIVTNVARGEFSAVSTPCRPSL